MDDDDAWAMEERMWTGSAAALAGALDPACLMVFPAPAGILDATAAVAALDSAPRWRDVVLSERRIGRPADDLLVLAYRAVGARDGAAPYHARCSSTYRRADEGWRLVQHQQTPMS